MFPPLTLIPGSFGGGEVARGKGGVPLQTFRFTNHISLLINLLTISNQLIDKSHFYRHRVCFYRHKHYFFTTPFRTVFKIRIYNLIRCQEVCFLTANEIANSYFENCSKRSLKAPRANPASSHAKIEQIYKSFSYFSRFTNLFHKLKYFRYVEKTL